LVHIRDAIAVEIDKTIVDDNVCNCTTTYATGIDIDVNVHHRYLTNAKPEIPPPGRPLDPIAFHSSALTSSLVPTPLRAGSSDAARQLPHKDLSSSCNDSSTGIQAVTATVTQTAAAAK